MRARTFAISVSVVLSLVLSPVFFLLLPARAVQAQQTPFLITPYYGNATITSRFDHEHPTYATNNVFRRSDGARWTNPPTPVDVNNCTQGVNCYDGHNGYDFVLAGNGGYDRVLAAADGTVTLVRWQDLGCHRGNQCGYGLHIEITHSNGYVTHYAHLSAAAVLAGEYVRAGRIIGTGGNTGNSTGVHLHFDVRNANGRVVDPFGWTGAGNDPWAVDPNGATSWFMWAGGEFAGNPIVDPTPVGSPTIYVDDTTNNTGGFDKGSAGPFNNVCQGDCGGWASQATGIGNHLYHTPADRTRAAGGDQWARWRPTIPLPGVYEVWVYVPTSTNTTSWQAPYVIETGSGQFTAYGIDQEGLRNQWVCIGAYHFLSGSRAYVYVTDATGEVPDYPGRRVGVDQVKFVRRPTYPAYAPDVRTSGGWEAQVVIRNNSSSPANVNIAYLDSNGSFECGTPNVSPWVIPAHGSVTFNCSYGDTASGVVDANQDVAVVVENEINNHTERTNYSGILPAGSSGSPGWEQTGTTLYAPVIKRQRYGRSSTIHVVNAGSQATTVYVYYYDDGGTARAGGSYALDPNGMAAISPSGGGSGGCNATGSVCSARIYTSNGQPLAGVVREYNDAGGLSVTTHNTFNAGAPTIYFPSVKYKRYDMSTGLRIQNVGGAAATITVRFYEQDGTYKCTLSSGSAVPAKAAKTFNLDDTCPGEDFGGNVLANAAQPLVGMANEVSSDGRYKKAYSSFLGGSQTAYGPLVYRSYSQNGYVWDAGIAVRNLSTQSASVNLYYYHSSGALAGQQLNQTINGRGTGVYFASLSNFKGSVLITANRDVAAVVNVVNNASSGDTHAIYNASNR